MAGQEQVALGSFVMRTKEYLVAVRAREGALALTTMLFEDEVRPAKDIPTAGKKPSKKQLDSAVAIVEELCTEWEPERYKDCYRERLKRVIDAKRKRKAIDVPSAEKEPKPVPDLMDALERTLEQLKMGEDPRAEAQDARKGAKSAR
jgi:DNA end-binding protein Ku